jgi:hypothetical protein
MGQSESAIEKLMAGMLATEKRKYLSVRGSYP